MKKYLAVHEIHYAKDGEPVVIAPNTLFTPVSETQEKELLAAGAIVLPKKSSDLEEIDVQQASAAHATGANENTSAGIAAARTTSTRTK